MAEPKPQLTIPTLYHLSSSQSFPVLMALEEAAGLRPDGLEYNLELFERKRGVAPPELKKVHPLGKSPVMKVRPRDGSGEEEVLTESRLLIRYIADNYTSGEWEPTTETDKKRAIFFEEFLRASFQLPVVICQIFKIIPSMLPFGLKQLAKAAFSPILSHFTADLKVFYRYMEDSFSEEQPWFSGAKFGLADFNGLFAMGVAIEYDLAWDPKEYPKLAKWHDAVTQRESYKKALEKAGTNT